MGVVTRESVTSDCTRLRVRFVPWSEAGHYTNVQKWARLFNWSAETMWQTQRPRIYHPSWVSDPLDHWQTVAHELVHWRQQGPTRLPTWWWCARYGVSSDFRWRMEREAYLVNIAFGMTPAVATDILQRQYMITVPREEMIAWFEAHHGV